jgi:hypothetical protein
MRINPTGADLLSLSRQTLLDELLPLLPESAHYTARMIANSMAIAQRQLNAGDQALDQELDTLQQWQQLAGRPKSKTTAAGWADLSAAVNSGALDGGSAVAAQGRALLWLLTINRVAESAPRMLPKG